MSGRNPSWVRDELILALDLFMRHNPVHISNNHPEVLALSEVLNKLPIHQQRPDATRFRNPNGVYMKLCNFLRFDPDYAGKGLIAGGKLEEEIWNQFHDKPELLHEVASTIKNVVQSKEAVSIQTPDNEEAQAIEGRVLFRFHRIRERNQNLVNKKKRLVFAQCGELRCEVCSFNFEYQYGSLGKGYIECHHTVLLSKLEPTKKTKLSDLALVCSNCHRMLHRGLLSIEELKSRISEPLN